MDRYEEEFQATEARVDAGQECGGVCGDIVAQHGESGNLTRGGDD